MPAPPGLAFGVAREYTINKRSSYVVTGESCTSTTLPDQTPPAPREATLLHELGGFFICSCLHRMLLVSGRFHAATLSLLHRRARAYQHVAIMSAPQAPPRGSGSRNLLPLPPCRARGFALGEIRRRRTRSLRDRAAEAAVEQFGKAGEPTRTRESGRARPGTCGPGPLGPRLRLQGWMVSPRRNGCNDFSPKSATST